MDSPPPFYFFVLMCVWFPLMELLLEQKTTKNSKTNILLTLRQRAAFALASAPFDSSSSDFDTRLATQHFHKLTVRSGMPLRTVNLWKCWVASLVSKSDELESNGADANAKAALCLKVSSILVLLFLVVFCSNSNSIKGNQTHISTKK